MAKAERKGAGRRELAALKRELGAMQKRCTKLWGELGAQEQEFVERKMSGAPAEGAFRRYATLRDRYGTAETRRVQLRGRIAGRSAPGDDLP